MAKHKFQQTLARLLREIVQLFKTLTGQFVRWFLRTILVTKRWRQGQAAGFVLPTIAFMLMVVSLVVAAILFRTFTRTTQVIEQGRTEVIQNAATPGIERAKSKLEYLFTVDQRIPAGIPGEDVMESILLNDGTDAAQITPDPYTLSDETRIDINGDGVNDSAWKFKDVKTGVTTVYAILSRAERGNYTIDPGNTNKTFLGNKTNNNPTDDEIKADNLLVRNGPVATASASGNSSCPAGGGDSPVGWFAGSNGGANLYKNFQVYAMALDSKLDKVAQPNSSAVATPAVATLQYQQDRVFQSGNKWGAWFRYDLEIFPGPTFRWNGAIHSEGNIFANSQNLDGQNPGGLISYLISAQQSCFFKPRTNSTIDAKGYLIAGTIRDNNYSAGTVNIHYQPNEDSYETTSNLTKLDNTTDSIKQVNSLPIDISIDPLRLLTQLRPVSRVGRGTNTWDVDPNWGNSNLNQRMIINQGSCAPYVDDTYRADNRYGPKPGYTRETADANGDCRVVGVGAIGSDIATNVPAATDPVTAKDLINNDPPIAEIPENVGLDGYWERRARNEGLRVLVGQRLELGNTFGWNVDLDDNDNDRNYINDPLTAAPTAGAPSPIDRDIYPSGGPDDTSDASDNTPSWAGSRRNEAAQYRTMRDNLAAVQATAVYHKSFGNNGYFPVACLATTVHPGTQKTLRDSTTFSQPQTGNVFNTKTGAASIFGNQFGEAGTNNEILNNFFTGEGTNGWEFEPIQDVNNNGLDATDITTFVTDINTSNSPLRIALKNLAYFAGDPVGAYPPTQDAGGTNVHPYSKLNMWGDFSNLRRAINLLETNQKRYPSPGNDSTANNYLSLADQSYIQTAACTLGMLAYNVSYVQEFNYNDATASPNGNKDRLNRLDARLQLLSDGPGTPAAYGNKSQTDSRNNGEVEVVAPPTANPRIEIYQNNLIAANPAIVQVPIDPNNPQAPPPEAFIAAIQSQAAIAGSGQALAQADLELFKLIHLKEQVERDRKFGFRNTPTDATDGTSVAVNEAGTTKNNYKYRVNKLTAPFIYAGVTYNTAANDGAGNPQVALPGRAGNLINLGCDVSNTSGNNYFGFGAPTTEADEQRFVRLATSLCPAQPKFPSLYYVFPKYNHTHQGNLIGVTFPNTALPGTANDYLQPGNPTLGPTTPAEPYVNDTYITGATVNGGPTFQYTALASNNGVAGVEDGNDFNNGIAAIALKPRVQTTGANRCTSNNWCLPAVSGAGGTPTPANIITDRVTNAAAPASIGVAFLDKAMFDGREMMSERLLDFDIDLLRKNATLPTNNQDAWLPSSGLIYAFREDAVREDAIQRPALMAANNYAQYPNDSTPGTGVWPTSRANPTGAANIMNVWAPTDPPLINNISPKPVDYYPDPARRSYGFRLRNGSDLRRSPLFGDNAPQNQRGMSLVSDNPVYIQGDFNLHTQEEFTEPLQNNYSNFYTRSASSLNPNFARSSDRWRVTEIIADSVNILSNSWNVCTDGNIQSTLHGNNSNNSRTLNAAGNQCTTRSSYSSVHRGQPADLIATSPGYMCENPFDPRVALLVGTTRVSDPNRLGCDGPVKVFRNGDIKYFNSGGTLTSYTNFWGFNNTARRDAINNATNTQVNAILVSGVVASRVNSSNGGFHNFPRLNENWFGGPTLSFFGSMLQLNFSNYATAPYDQDAWEPSGAAPVAAEQIHYYRAANRRWGYDVGLQYASAGPAAKRMVTPATDRSEFYRELAADDPYICNLRQAIGYDCP